MTKELFQAACLRFLNLPYIWGGDDPIKGFDCSGLVQELYAMIGIDPKGDQNAQMLYDHFVSIDVSVQKIGTLVFYGKSIREITHVAMVIDAYYGIIIEAGGGGSKSVDAESASNMNAFVRLRPMSHRKDLVAKITPANLPW